ncbi:hypothetical protein HPB49_002177 [Dermacentor silvarum]|uniref:Uncharacterized protein n=1 Tax=Dermacentor silvarum TaxID=543639 RepID=A0ACB8DMC2_DERSI|nr:hypothetical protein HPB49_002177 [Dermacentor silvarum]
MKEVRGAKLDLCTPACILGTPVAGARTDVLEASGSGSVAFAVGIAGLSNAFPALVCSLSQVSPSSERTNWIAQSPIRWSVQTPFSWAKTHCSE